VRQAVQYGAFDALYWIACAYLRIYNAKIPPEGINLCLKEGINGTLAPPRRRKNPV
jgi:hypothetical protein